jgi:hypothetical protein
VAVVLKKPTAIHIRENPFVAQLIATKDILAELFVVRKHMAHYKRKKCKNARAGCLMCKMHKVNGTSWRRKYPKLAAYAEQDEKDSLEVSI